MMSHQVWLRWMAALLLLLAGPVRGGSSQSSLPEPVAPEPYPFSDHYPAEVLVETPQQLETLSTLGVEVEGLRPAAGGVLGEQFQPVIASVYLNDKMQASLAAAGLFVVPVPNQGLRARLLDGSGFFKSSGWPTLSEVETRLQNLAAGYPEIIRLVSIGISVQGRHIWCLQISDQPDSEENEPEVRLSAAIHGDETVGMELLLRLAEYLAGGYAADAQVRNLVDEMEIWLCPLHNPDGYAAVSRFNANGTDLNRDFPESKLDEADSSANLEPENQAFWNLQQEHNFVIGANYHGGAQVANYPWDAHHGAGDTCAAAPDDTIFYAYSKEYAASNPDLPGALTEEGVVLGCVWYQILHGMQDWAYAYYGEHHITLEISNDKTPPFNQMDTYWEHNRQAMLDWIGHALSGARGVVTDAVSGVALPATLTLLDGSGLDVMTDPQVGDYHRLLLPGTYTLQASAICYLPQVATLTVGSGLATVQDFGLLPDLASAQCLPTPVELWLYFPVVSR